MSGRAHGDDSEATGGASAEGAPLKGGGRGRGEGSVESTRVVGVDLGSKRIGIALSDPARIVASPHVVLQRAGDQDLDHQAIVTIARETGATTIVVGLPLSLSGAEGPAARATRREVQALEAVAAPDIAVVVHDERLTTVTAEAALAEARMGRAARREVVDKVAAAVMLQAWLESGGR